MFIQQKNTLLKIEFLSVSFLITSSVGLHGLNIGVVYQLGDFFVLFSFFFVSLKKVSLFVFQGKKRRLVEPFTLFPCVSVWV